MTNRYVGELGTDVYGTNADEGKIAKLSLTATQSAAAGAVHAAITGSSSAIVTITADITDPPYPRNLVVTPGGTTADVKAGDIVIHGTNICDDVISEAFTFADNGAGAITGLSAFKTVTSIVIHIQDGASATFAVTFADVLGLPFILEAQPFIWASDDGITETTAPTVVTDDDEIEKNTIALNTAMDGSIIKIILVL